MTTKKPCKRTRFNNLHWSFKFYPKTFCLAANGRVLTNSITAPNFADVINASAAGSNGSVIYGYGGNDALSGSSGKDDIFGGDGDDLIGGGQGSDTIKGGAGNDHINSSATLDVAQRMRPSDSWSPPAGQEVLARGPLWGIYLDNDVGGPATVWSASNNPLGSDGDVVDGGAGNDHIIASGGDDRVQGGLGDDQIDGLGGNDILEGGDGQDIIVADGTLKAGFMNTVEAQYHGADFVDGGAGNDTLTAGGGDDVVYGGADNDRMWGDVSGKTSDAGYLDVAFHGNDYMDGEDIKIAAYARQACTNKRFGGKNELNGWFVQGKKERKANISPPSDLTIYVTLDVMERI